MLLEQDLYIGGHRSLISSKPEAADFALGRVNLIPSKVIDGLVMDKTLELIGSWTQENMKLDTLRPLLEDVLYRFIGTLEEQDHQHRRMALAWKRDVYNGRMPKLKDSEIKSLLEKMSDEDRAVAEEWLQSVKRVSLLREELECSYSEEVGEAGSWLAKQLGHEALQKGIQISSKTYLDHYNRQDNSQWFPREGYARTAIQYLLRASMKTSPFSTFTQMAVTYFGDQAQVSTNDPGPGSSVSQGHVRLYQPLIYSWLTALAKDKEYGGVFSFKLNPSIRMDRNNELQLLAPEYSVSGNFAVKSEKLKNVEPLKAFIEQVTSSGLTEGTKETWTELLHCESDFSRLIEENVLIPVIPVPL